MGHSRDNHYVPEWYQKGFIADGSSHLHCLDLNPDVKDLPSGETVRMNSYRRKPPSKSFVFKDLYTTFFGPLINDDIERYLFGEIDRSGATALRAFIEGSMESRMRYLEDFIEYIDAQKLRTPKGLAWINSQYPNLTHSELMREMQSIRRLNCTMWGEGVREIVSAKNCEASFIISDHPVTAYNAAFDPLHARCEYPNDPPISLIGTQTIFPLDHEHCLIFTNYEYATNPNIKDPNRKRQNARNFGFSFIRSDSMIRCRELNDSEVEKINVIIKSRAQRYLAASQKSLLYPEKRRTQSWSELGSVLLPPKNELYQFGGESYMKFVDGSTRYQDAFGRSAPINDYLKKSHGNHKPGRNDACICGSGKKYKKCCLNKPPEQRTTSEELSIRERNLAFCTMLGEVLNLRNQTWDELRASITPEQISEIHSFYSALWPAHTDITELLPKPDGVLRALYTGLIDPRSLLPNVPNLCLYFDEVLIHSPFLNSINMKPEFSPVEMPKQYLYQTLKNALLFLSLETYIDAGLVNIFPDPTVFNEQLHQQMFQMARQRTKNIEIDKEEEEFMRQFLEDDYKRTIFMLSEDQQRRIILEGAPDSNDETVDGVLERFDALKAKDPFAPLHENVFGTWGGQLMMQMMAPNFEVAMLMAKLTGSILVTDSQFRWREILASNATPNSSEYGELEKVISEYLYHWDVNYENVFNLRMQGKGRELRLAHKNVFSMTVDASQITNESRSALLKNLLDAQTHMKSELEGIEGTMSQAFKCVIPEEGFTHRNVQRLLVTSGIENHLSRVPMAIYFGK